MELKLSIGPMAPKLAEQIGFTDETIEHFQRDLDAQNRLFVRSMLTYGEVEKVRKRIVKAIAKHVNKQSDPIST